MKKVVLSVAIMSFALLANAQVLKKDLLKVINQVTTGKSCLW